MPILPASDDAPRERDIAIIHEATALYTVAPEVDRLLDLLGWPESGGALLDPGAGDGAFLVAALARLKIPRDDVDGVVPRLCGYEFHAPAADAARRRFSAALIASGWSPSAATEAARAVVERRDFLLEPPEPGRFACIASNPPYLTRRRVPQHYRATLDHCIPRLAQADLLHAFIRQATHLVADRGKIGLVTSDRWLLNDSAAQLRAEVGGSFRIRDVQRLDATSSFYRPKTRSASAPPRVHPVSFVLEQNATRGRQLTRSPFQLEERALVDGIRLGDLANIQLAPWLGPDGIFTIDDPRRLPDADLAPVVKPRDIDQAGDRLLPPRRWAIVTRAETPPPLSVQVHLEREMVRMPPRGRRRVPWLPPETFAHRLPLTEDAVLVPRISRRLRALRLPARSLPVAHDLAVAAGVPVETLQRWLLDEEVQQQAVAFSPRLEDGYRSFTTRRLANLIIPRRLLGDV